MRGLEKNRMKRDRQTNIHTDGHRDSMIESAQWADSMKISHTLTNSCHMETVTPNYGFRHRHCHSNPERGHEFPMCSKRSPEILWTVRGQYRLLKEVLLPHKGCWGLAKMAGQHRCTGAGGDTVYTVLLDGIHCTVIQCTQYCCTLYNHCPHVPAQKQF